MDDRATEKCGQNFSRISGDQVQRQFLGLSCENSVQQNGIQFAIQCSHHQVNIRYPQGEFLLKTE